MYGSAAWLHGRQADGSRTPTSVGAGREKDAEAGDVAPFPVCCGDPSCAPPGAPGLWWNVGLWATPAGDPKLDGAPSAPRALQARGPAGRKSAKPLDVDAVPRGDADDASALSAASEALVRDLAGALGGSELWRGARAMDVGCGCGDAAALMAAAEDAGGLGASFVACVNASAPQVDIVAARVRRCAALRGRVDVVAGTGGAIVEAAEKAGWLGDVDDGSGDDAAATAPPPRAAHATARRRGRGASPQRQGGAHTRTAPPASLVRGSHFDVIVSVDAAYHFATRRSFAQDACFLLHGGGRLGVVDVIVSPEYSPQGAGFVGRAVFALLSRLGVLPAENTRTNTPAQYAAMLREAGFRDVRVVEVPLEATILALSRWASARPRRWRAKLSWAERARWRVVASATDWLARNRVVTVVRATATAP